MSESSAVNREGSGTSFERRSMGMSARTRCFGGSRVVVTIFLLMAVCMVPARSMATPTDDAYTGSLLRTVSIVSPSPLPAYCTSTQAGTSLAIVQASKVLILPNVAITDPNSILLVTSCRSSQASTSSTLYFADPTTGTVLKTIQTTQQVKQGGRFVTVPFAPGQGWAELVVAANRGVMFGCATDGSLYKIDYSLFGSAAAGTTTLMAKPAGSPAMTTCTGVAWDPAANIIYQSTSSVIASFQFTDPSTLTSPVTLLPPPCGVSGLSVVGGVLLVGCNAPTPTTPAGTTTVFRLNRLSTPTPGAQLDDNPPNKLHTAMNFANGALAGQECDPITFSKVTVEAPFGNIEGIWSRIPGGNQVKAFRVPTGTCGLPPKSTVFAPAACPDTPPAGSPYLTYRNADGSPIDSDRDGLWDCGEDRFRWAADADGTRRPGIDFDGDGLRDLTLCATVATSIGSNGQVNLQEECADPNQKNIFVEVDFMTGHEPDDLALLDVRQAFLSAPVDAPNGIKVHFVVDEEIPHTDNLALEPCTVAATAANGAVDFDALKRNAVHASGLPGWFGTAAERTGASAQKTLDAKSFAYHYMLFAHNLANTTTSAVGSSGSGCSELPGKDSAITMGSWAVSQVTGHPVGSRNEQAGTVMHELGHNLGLRHGGGDGLNCKPNYLSIMSYSFQFNDL